VVYLQQLGRGLRLKAGKERLVVIDFIGNHRSFQLLFSHISFFREMDFLDRLITDPPFEERFRSCVPFYTLRPAQTLSEHKN